MSSPLEEFPGFFDRTDPSPDGEFYSVPRLVTHIDDRAIAAVAALYAELGVDGDAVQPHRVLDLMSSWTSHLLSAPAELIVLGLNQVELEANPMATERIVHDLNVDPRLPLADRSVDAVLCCVSVDYLIHPVEVLAEAARVMRPGATIAITFSNRYFPSKVIRGWLATDDAPTAPSSRNTSGSPADSPRPRSLCAHRAANTAETPSTPSSAAAAELFG